MGISVSTQDGSGFDSSGSLQPPLQDEHIGPCPGCVLKWVLADGEKNPWEWGPVTLTTVVERGRRKPTFSITYFIRTVLLVTR